MLVPLKAQVRLKICVEVNGDVLESAVCGNLASGKFKQAWHGMAWHGMKRRQNNHKGTRHEVYEHLNETLSSTAQVVDSELRFELRVT